MDRTGNLLHVNVSRHQIKDAPRYDPPITIDEAYEEKFLTYYGAYEEKFLTYYGIKWITK